MVFSFWVCCNCMPCTPVSMLVAWVIICVRIEQKHKMSKIHASAMGVVCSWCSHYALCDVLLSFLFQLWWRIRLSEAPTVYIVPQERSYKWQRLRQPKGQLIRISRCTEIHERWPKWHRLSVFLGGVASCLLPCVSLGKRQVPTCSKCTPICGCAFGSESSDWSKIGAGLRISAMV